MRARVSKFLCFFLLLLLTSFMNAEQVRRAPRAHLAQHICAAASRQQQMKRRRRRRLSSYSVLR